MKMETMKSIPRTREDFERNMYVLVEKIRCGQHYMVEETGQAKSLMNVRELTNKRLNFLTVNETARLSANHIASMMDMDFSEFLPKEDEHQNP